MTHLAHGSYSEGLERLVRSWPWVLPDATQLGVNALIVGAARGVGVEVPTVFPPGPGGWWTASCLVGEYAHRGEEGGWTPLGASLMAIWARALRRRLAVPPGLDRLVLDALAEGDIPAEAFGGRWSLIDETWPGREVPDEVRARATVELALGRGRPGR